MAIPMFDQGVALNMVILLRKEPAAFASEELPELVWMSNLFGRATSSLVMSEDLQRANQALDREMKAVGDIQRSLLPAHLPKIPTLDIATHYHPSQRAGGDYYDFFPLPDGKWGIFIADVSGHGTPAAVLMAVTHCIAHTNPGQAQPPAQILDYLNHHLATLYTSQNESFVTAFYGVYDPSLAALTYACAGHNPPRLKRCQDGTLLALESSRRLAPGNHGGHCYDQAVQQLMPATRSSSTPTASPKPAIPRATCSAPIASTMPWKIARCKHRHSCNRCSKTYAPSATATPPTTIKR